MKYYKVSEDKLKELITHEWELLELENAGVDNWGGYEETEEILEEEVNKYIESEFTISL